MLSVIIPARNEQYLEKTIRNILENARGEIEVISILDGWLPEPQINIGDERAIFFHFPESIGQRQAINFGASKARGDFVMKLDAHCAVDEGFDVKLASDCHYEWTVIPRMYNLDANTWLPKRHKLTDYMYIAMKDGDIRAEYYKGEEYKRQHRKHEQIDDIMCCMGPGFFMNKKRFWELGGCDEKHGSWGQQGIELACKAWLSGGALKVNKKTWFAHWFRGGSGPGFPYHLSGSAVAAARKYSKDLWMNNNWPKATRKFQWLLDKFSPPGWHMIEKDTNSMKNTDTETQQINLYTPRKAKSHVHGRGMTVKILFDNLDYYWDYRKRSRAAGFKEHAVKFFTEVHQGKTFTDDELLAHPYYTYIKAGFKTDSPNEFIRIMRDGISLYHDMKVNGLKYPMEMWVENGKYNISTGTRRLLISHLLGKQTIAVRVYADRKFMEMLRPCKNANGSIQLTAQRQFQKWGWKATDKYWLHDYTHLYDDHCAKLIPDAKNILEVGVKRGASLMLWQDVFPNARIFGVDIETKAATLIKNAPRITLLEGSQTDEIFNRDVVAPCGPFDLIVDDASHIPEHQIKGFENLWETVKPGGVYVVEDLYYRNYHRKNEALSMIAKLNELIDEMNIRCEIAEMHFYYNICFIVKR